MVSPITLITKTLEVRNQQFESYRV